MSRAKQPSIFVRNNPAAPQLCPELAKEIGLNESILLLQWEYWLRTDGQERDGHFWLRRTVREIQEAFPFWGIATIQRTLGSLSSEKCPLLVLGNYDEGPGRGAGWFRLNLEALQALKSIKVDCSKMEQRMFQNDRKSDQNGTSVLSRSFKDLDITPSGYKVPKKPPEPKTLHPPEEFAIQEWMRVYLAERFIEFSATELADLTDSWRRARLADSEKKRTVDQWQWDWLRYVCTAWQKRPTNGHKQGSDDNSEHPAWMASPKPADYFEKQWNEANGK